MVSSRSVAQSSWVARKIGGFIAAVSEWCDGSGSVSAVAFEVGVDAHWLLRFMDTCGLCDKAGRPVETVAGRRVTPELVMSALSLYWLGRAVVPALRECDRA